MLRPKAFFCCRFAIGLILVAIGTGCSFVSTEQLALKDRAETGHTLVRPTSRPDVLRPESPPSGAADSIKTNEQPEEIPGEPLEIPEAGPAERVYDFPVEVNDRVEAALRRLQTQKAVTISQAFLRARRYIGRMRTIFREKGLPEELVSLAFVESGVNPHATSRAKAAGIWQFVPTTGRSYGMRTGSGLDERRDPEKSTHAAAGYLKSLYERFESWPLALAAYNAGEAAVQRAIDRQHTRDFWRLRLPKQTQRFVPTFMAVTLITRDPKRYGFAPLTEDPHDTEILHVSQPTELRRIAEAAGVSVDRLRELNPEIVGSTTPRDDLDYALRIPRRLAWVAHTVGKGETLGGIAQRYGVSVQVLREMNRLTDSDVLKAGGVLLVPTVSAPSPD